MSYLVIMIVVAAAGITRLWLQQRRESAHLNSVDGFRESLEKISDSYPSVVQQTPRTRRTPTVSTGRHQPMDPARREAAKRRIEARRRARQRVA